MISLKELSLSYRADIEHFFRGISGTPFSFDAVAAYYQVAYASELISPRPRSPQPKEFPSLRFDLEYQEFDHNYQRDRYERSGVRQLLLGNNYIGEAHRKPHPLIEFDPIVNSLKGVDRLAFACLLKVLKTDFPNVKVVL